MNTADRTSKLGFGQSIAVVIGIDAYENGIAALETARNDAARLSNILEQTHWYERACSLMSRNMSLTEWEVVLPGHVYQCTCPSLPPHPTSGVDACPAVGGAPD